MKTEVPRRLIATNLAAIALVAAMITLGAANPPRRDDPVAAKAGDFSPYVAKDGGITRPTDYRETFVHLGTYAVATKPGRPVDEMHVVYSRPEDVKAYRRDGKFPDGAVLVKEITGVKSDRTRSRPGQSHWSNDVKGLVRADQGREGPVPRQRPVGRRLGELGVVPGEVRRPGSQRGDRLRGLPTARRATSRPGSDDWIYVRGYPPLTKADSGQVNGVTTSSHG